MQPPAALPSDAAQLKAIANWLKIISSREEEDDEKVLTNGNALFQVLSAIYEDVLHIEISVPTLDLNGRKPAEDQLAILHRMIVIAIAKSEANEIQIGAMQSLPYEQQMILMQVIESDWCGPNLSKEEENEPVNNDLNSPNEEKAETLRLQLAKQKELTIMHQDQLTHAMEQLEQVTQENKQMAEELSHLRDCEQRSKVLQQQVEEWKPVVDLSKRQEAQLDQYHERLDEVTELQQEVKKLRAERSKAEKDLKISESNGDEPHNVVAFETLQQGYTKLQQEYKKVEQEKNKLLERCKTLENGEESAQAKFDNDDVDENSSSHPETLISLRDEIARLQNQLESTKLVSGMEHDAAMPHDPAARRESHLAAIHAEITAMRNNARSKEKEAHSSKDTERECDALRLELRLMSSAYHTLSQHVYRDTSWNQLVVPHIENPIAKSEQVVTDTPSPVPPASNSSWLGQQREYLAGALRFARK
ncbi:hypothetical protein MYAM1_002800 [Malassezia yamatoensis]|uniref:Uncharacterized protein n=1 Tax=Malassezia yamatoensis TaxID=253288 RepID=A0AAJ5YST1_9BASI|nr:hypothetical protein MYAM1_002800 [Malassezia yamatoensis]